MNIKYLGIDLAKDVFQLGGLSRSGKPIYAKRVRRPDLLKTVANIKPYTIAVEACSGAFYWQREFEKLGHKVKVISPQYVKPFIKGQKNDSSDAQGIAIALMQPTMNFVPPKNTVQQDIQALHRARQRLVAHRSATVCQIRGLLLERGIIIAKSLHRARRAIPLILEDASNDLSMRMRRTLAELFDLMISLDARVTFFDKEIGAVFKESEDCQRIAKIKGVGPKTATAVIAAIGDGKEFKNGRHFSAWLGLVPRQYSSGDNRVTLNITKRGDQHLRTLLVHGGRAVVRTARKEETPLNRWASQLKEKPGYNKAAVAVANKNARIIWAVLNSGEPYRAASL